MIELSGLKWRKLIIIKMRESVRLQLKKLKYEIRKQIGYRLFKYKICNLSGDLSNEIRSLILSGQCRIHSKEIKNLVGDLVDKYSIDELILKKGPRNLSVPLLDDISIDQLYSIIYKRVNTYYELMYGTKAFLQDSPKLVITNPEYNHKIGDKMNNFPELFHKDYFSEVTVHVPVSEISTKTPFTEYVEKTHMQSRFLDKYYLSAKAKRGYISTKMLSNVGSYLIMDVNGVHKGSTTAKSNFRIMIQYKFVSTAFKHETDLLKVYNTQETAVKIKNAIKYFFEKVEKASNLLEKVNRNATKKKLDSNQTHAKLIFERYFDLINDI